jgi:hypothetical protein
MLILIIIIILVLFPALDAHSLDLTSVTSSHYSHILTIRRKQHTYHFTTTTMPFHSCCPFLILIQPPCMLHI